MTDIYIQMVLDESLYNRRLAMLTDQINKALDEKDKDAFLTLSKEYAALKQANKPILQGLAFYYPFTIVPPLT